jgi:hypothetical protein
VKVQKRIASTSPIRKEDEVTAQVKVLRNAKQNVLLKGEGNGGG